jgi:hypothetical protein
VSQSAQWAPFNAAYIWDNSTDNLFIADTTLSHQNSYSGGVFQQATSVVSTTSAFSRSPRVSSLRINTLFADQGCYQLIDQCYAVQGFEYVPGYNDAVRRPLHILLSSTHNIWAVYYLDLR